MHLYLNKTQLDIFCMKMNLSLNIDHLGNIHIFFLLLNNIALLNIYFYYNLFLLLKRFHLYTLSIFLIGYIENNLWDIFHYYLIHRHFLQFFHFELYHSPEKSLLYIHIQYFLIKTFFQHNQTYHYIKLWQNILNYNQDIISNHQNWEI